MVASRRAGELPEQGIHVRRREAGRVRVGEGGAGEAGSCLR